MQHDVDRKATPYSPFLMEQTLPGGGRSDTKQIMTEDNKEQGGWNGCVSSALLHN